MPSPRNADPASPSLARVRPAMAADLAAIAAIQAERLRRGLATPFAPEPLPLRGVMELRERLLTQGYPWLVAVDGADGLLGFAFAAPFAARGAWRWTVEGTVSVWPDRAGQGAERALLSGLLAACEVKGFRQMVAVIAEDAEGAGLVSLHRALGFARAGVLRAIGMREDMPVDSVLLQRALGAGMTDAEAA